MIMLFFKKKFIQFLKKKKYHIFLSKTEQRDNGVSLVRRHVRIRTPSINQEKLYFNQTHIWDLFVLYLLEQKYPSMWMWSWHHQPQ